MTNNIISVMRSSSNAMYQINSAAIPIIVNTPVTRENWSTTAYSPPRHSDCCFHIHIVNMFAIQSYSESQLPLIFQGYDESVPHSSEDICIQVWVIVIVIIFHCTSRWSSAFKRTLDIHLGLIIIQHIHTLRLTTLEIPYFQVANQVCWLYARLPDWSWLWGQ
jgi:hypothetical protein